MTKRKAIQAIIYCRISLYEWWLDFTQLFRLGSTKFVFVPVLMPEMTDEIEDVISNVKKVLGCVHNTTQRSIVIPKKFAFLLYDSVGFVVNNRYKKNLYYRAFNIQEDMQGHFRIVSNWEYHFVDTANRSRNLWASQNLCC